MADCFVDLMLVDGKKRALVMVGWILSFEDHDELVSSRVLLFFFVVVYALNVYSLVCMYHSEFENKEPMWR